MAIVATVVLAALMDASALSAQSAPRAGNASQVAQRVREYRVQQEGAIVRELAEFLAIPNVASDEANIQRNAARLVEMLTARGVETELLPIAGRGPVVFGKLMTPGAKRTVIFYAHYDGQPVDASA
jgi:acetylornithine deacetylase/succinyl-diaminopimelate desuccinylase-like protein